MAGTNGVAVLAYRINNYVGSATISPGDNSFTEATNGRNLEKVLRPGEVLQATDDVGDEVVYLTISSVSSSSVSFEPSYTGDNPTTTPIYTRKKVVRKGEGHKWTTAPPRQWLGSG